MHTSSFNHPLGRGLYVGVTNAYPVRTAGRKGQVWVWSWRADGSFSSAPEAGTSAGDQHQRQGLSVAAATAAQSWSQGSQLKFVIEQQRLTVHIQHPQKQIMRRRRRAVRARPGHDLPEEAPWHCLGMFKLEPFPSDARLCVGASRYFGVVVSQPRTQTTGALTFT